MEQHFQLNDSHLQPAVSLEAQLRERYARAAYHLIEAYASIHRKLARNRLGAVRTTRRKAIGPR